MRQNNIELGILIKGRPVTEYPHMGQVFIEGRDGSQYEIEVKNHNPFRVEAVLSVDGLSVTDGKDAGTHSSGYLIDAHGSIRVPGWKLNSEQVAAFAFAGKRQSYAAQSTGSARNTGVIGLMAFAEKRQAYRPVASPFRIAASGHHEWSGGSNHLFGGGLRAMGMASLDGAATLDAAATMDWMDQDQSRGITAMACAAPPVEQTLGTAFGKATEFATSTVAFERGDLASMMVLYYDDSKGLRQRGIVLAKPSRQHLSQPPQAFPAMSGCTPPPGWRG